MACQVEEETGSGSLIGQGGAEGLLGGVHHVEEAVLVALTLVHLGDGGRHGDHAVAISQQEEGLVRVQLQAPPGGGDQDMAAWGEIQGDRKRKELTLEPPGVAVYLKPPKGQMYPLLECIDFQGSMFFYLSY